MSHKFVSCFWLNGNVKEATEFYLAAFDQTSQGKTDYFVDDLHGEIGDILTVSLTLANHKFVLLNGGPEFKPTPAISYMVTCSTEADLKELWNKLSENGTILMDIQELPGVGLFGWVNDPFGFSWQLQVQEGPQTITPCFLFANNNYGKGKEAIDFWLATFKQGQELFREPDEQGNIKIASFQLYDQTFYLMESDIPHAFSFSLANSFCIYCENQAEIDSLWDTVTKEGEEYPCGWMVDKFGVAWQTVTEELDEWLSSDKGNKAKQTMLALYEMKKIDLATLKKVYEETE